MSEETINQDNKTETNPDEVAGLRERITELEEALNSRNNELTMANTAVTELQEKLSNTNQVLTEAIADYRALILQVNPDVTEELINGDSIPAINESLAKAKSLISKVKQSIEKDVTTTHVPIGSPGRQTPDLSTLSPREKINYAMGGKK